MNALGIYLIFSLFFVLATMVEFAVVLVLERYYPKDDNKECQKWHDKTKSRRRKARKSFWSRTKGSLMNFQDAENISIANKKKSKRMLCSLTEKMDLFALFIFMFIYFLFNCVYFMHYM